MAKAKLTTRGISSSTVTSDNLAKGSQLTHNQLDSNFINLRDQTFGIAADDSATIQVGAGDTLYIQGGSNVTTSTDSAGVVTINATGGDSLGDLTAIGSTISSPSNAAITLDPSGTGTIELNANTNITGAATVSGAITGSSIKVGSRSSNATTGNTDDPTAGLFIGDPYTGIGDSTQVFVGQNDTPWMQQMGIDGLASNSQPMDANVIHNQVDDGHTYISTTGDGQVVIPRVKLGWPLSGITVNGTGTSPQVTIGSLSNEGNMLATINAGTIDVYTRIRTNEEQFPDSAGTYDGHGLQIQQNEIFSWASNDDVKIHANGSGRVHLENLTIADDGAVVTGIKDEDNMSSNSNVKLATQQSIKAYVDSQVSGVATGQGFKVVGDDSASVDIAEAGTLYIQGGTNVTTATDSAGVVTINAADNSLSLIDEDSFSTNSATRPPSQQSVKAYVDTQDAAIASDTLTFTNKTFDADGTGNNLSNIEVANLKSGVLDTDLSSVSGSDDTLASAKAIKAYVDSNSGASTGDITFVGSTMISPSNADITLNPAGTGKVNINAVYTLPNADGSANQVLGTNGSGVLSFRDPTAINIDGGVADSTYTSVPTIDGGTA